MNDREMNRFFIEEQRAAIEKTQRECSHREMGFPRVVIGLEDGKKMLCQRCLAYLDPREFSELYFERLFVVIPADQTPISDEAEALYQMPLDELKLLCA